MGSLLLSTLLALTAGLAVSTYLYNQSQARLQEVVKQDELKDSSLRRAEKTIDKMLKDVATELKNYPNTRELRESLLNDALELQLEMLEEHREDSVVVLRTMEAFARIATLQFQLGSADDSFATMEKGLEKFRSLPESIRTSQNGVFAKTLLQRNKALRLSQRRGNDEQALELFDAAIGELEALPDQSDVVRFRIAQCLGKRAATHFRNSDWQLALADNLHAVMLFDSTNLLMMKRETSLQKIDSQLQLGWIYHELKDSKKSLSATTDSIELANELVTTYLGDVDCHQTACRALSQRATLNQNLANYQAAITDWEQIIAEAGEMTVNVPQEYIFWDLLLLSNRGRLRCKELLNHKSLDAAYEKTIELGNTINEQFGSTSSRDGIIAILHANYATFLGKANKFDEAIEISEAGLGLREASLQQLGGRVINRIQYATEMARRAHFSFKLNEFSESTEWFAKSYAVLSKLFRDDSNRTKDMLAYLDFSVDHLVYNHYRIDQHARALEWADDYVALQPDSAKFNLDAARYLGYVLEHLHTESQLAPGEKTELLNRYLNPALRYWDKAISIEPEFASKKTESPFKLLFK